MEKIIEKIKDEFISCIKLQEILKLKSENIERLKGIEDGLRFSLLSLGLNSENILSFKQFAINNPIGGKYITKVDYHVLCKKGTIVSPFCETRNGKVKTFTPEGKHYPEISADNVYNTELFELVKN
jgi:hypothetical protein